jgi:hypothetical protein
MPYPLPGGRCGGRRERRASPRNKDPIDPNDHRISQDGRGVGHVKNKQVEENMHRPQT